MDKPDPGSDAAEQYKAQEPAVSLVIAQGDAVLLLEMINEAFDA